jgi:4-aminobutyrate aminotransferase-like enzyme
VAAGIGRFTSHSKPETRNPKRNNVPSHVGCHEVERYIRQIFRCERIGAILAEPVQGRGGIHVPPGEFLPLLRKLCDEHGALLILDEIFTGFGRTGKWFACEHTGVVPDLICLGKALTGGFPLSACVGRADLMDAAWPASRGEAIHTSTFLGHPVGCAMALAQIQEIERLELPQRSAELGAYLLKLLSILHPPSSILVSCRGLGLMAGVELHLADGRPATDAAMLAIKAMLQRGYILLPEGEHGNVISFTPPLTITRAQLAKTVAELQKVLTTD